MKYSALEFRRIGVGMEQSLAEFFNHLVISGENRFFHPHPFDDESVRKITQHEGKDLYYAILVDDKILGYGMLRGWDAGYEIPSLGIVIHPKVRGMGLGKSLMLFLHAASKYRGSKQIRLKVYPENKFARKLYQELGYIFQGEEDNQLIGILNL